MDDGPIVNNVQKVFPCIDCRCHIFIDYLLGHCELESEDVKQGITPDEANDMDLTGFDI